MMKHMTSGTKKLVFQKIAFIGLVKLITFGKWVIPVRVARALKFILIVVLHLVAKTAALWPWHAIVIVF